MKFKIIIIGKTKENYLQQGEKEFQKRLSRFCQLEWVIVKEQRFDANTSEQTIIKTESESILSKITKDDFVIALDRTGEQMTSEELAVFLQKKMNEGYSKITLIIGGTFGLGEKVLKSASTILSLSKMTFTHEMSRLILLEQLYRAFTILNGSKYHKA